MRRSIFTLALGLLMSLTAIGVTLPDRQIEDLDVMKVATTGIDADAVLMAKTSDLNVVVIESQDSFAETFKISNVEQLQDLFSTDSFIRIESLQEDAVKQRFDPYIMPNYKYKAIIKPPRITEHRS